MLIFNNRTLNLAPFLVEGICTVLLSVHDIHAAFHLRRLLGKHGDMFIVGHAFPVLTTAAHTNRFTYIRIF